MTTSQTLAADAFRIAVGHWCVTDAMAEARSAFYHAGVKPVSCELAWTSLARNTGHAKFCNLAVCLNDIMCAMIVFIENGFMGQGVVNASKEAVGAAMQRFEARRSQRLHSIASLLVLRQVAHEVAPVTRFEHVLRQAMDEADCLVASFVAGLKNMQLIGPGFADCPDVGTARLNTEACVETIGSLMRSRMLLDTDDSDDSNDVDAALMGKIRSTLEDSMGFGIWRQYRELHARVQRRTELDE